MISSRKYKKLANRVKFSYTFQSSLFIQQERTNDQHAKNLYFLKICLRDPPTRSARDDGTGNPRTQNVWLRDQEIMDFIESVYTMYIYIYISVYKIRRLMMINACQVMIDHLAYFSMSFMSLQDSLDMLTCWRVDVSMLIGTLRRSGPCEAALRHLRHLHFRRLALSQHRRERVLNGLPASFMVTQHGCNGDNRS